MGVRPIVSHSPPHTSIAVIGAGLTGMATAARLAVRGKQVTVFESHRSVGGCAGYFRRRGFSFDVGSTTLVDYGPGGVGGMRLTLGNSNQRAVPHDIGVSGWIQAGDTTWPGLGTTACAICSLIAAEDVCRLG